MPAMRNRTPPPHPPPHGDAVKERAPGSTEAHWDVPTPEGDGAAATQSNTSESPRQWKQAVEATCPTSFLEKLIADC